MQAKVATVLSDTAAFDPITGKVVGIMSKMTVSDAARAVVVVRGHQQLGRVMRLPAEPCSFDEVIDDLPEYVCDMATATRADTDLPTGAELELTAVGWSDRAQELQAWTAATFDAGAYQGASQLPGYKPYVAMRCPTLYGAPGYEPGPSSRSLEVFLGTDRETWDPKAFGMAAMQAIRAGARWLTTEAEGRAGGVGGLLEMAQVTRDGASCEVIARWPDRIGGWIDGEAVARPEPAVSEADVRAAFLS